MASLNAKYNPTIVNSRMTIFFITLVQYPISITILSLPFYYMYSPNYYDRKGEKNYSLSAFFLFYSEFCAVLQLQIFSTVCATSFELTF